MKLPRPLRERGVAVLAIALVLAFALSQFVEDSPAPVGEPSIAPGQAGMRAVIDPETGTLATGTEAQRLLSDKAMDEELRQMLNRSSEGLVFVEHPDGRVSVDLQGRFMNAAVAKVGQDGRLEQTCVQNVEEAEVFLDGEVAAGNDTSEPEVR